MKHTKQIFILSAVSFFAAFFFGCAGMQNYTQAEKDEAPLDDYSEVFETSRSVDEVFSDARSFLLDTYPESASSIAVQSQTNMIILPVEVSFIGYSSNKVDCKLKFTIVVEVKEGKMRFSTKDLKVYWLNKVNGVVHEIFQLDNDYGYRQSYALRIRKNASVTYAETTAELSKSMTSIAEGTLYSADW